MLLATIATFAVILAVLVLVHEAGHFFAARIFGIRADEFGFGFPPRAFRRAKIEKRKVEISKRARRRGSGRRDCVFA